MANEQASPSGEGTLPTARISGLYRRASQAGVRSRSRRDELRLDVDGHFPQRMASGILSSGLGQRVHWVASLTAVPDTAGAAWQGAIAYADVIGALPPFAAVTIRVAADTAHVVFDGPLGALPPQDYTFESPYFGRVEFEFDTTTDAQPSLVIDTRAHPNCPDGLAREQLSVQTVFERVGFQVETVEQGPRIPLQGAGADTAWSDCELHDAMRQYWSRHANRPRWAMWVFHAGVHADGPDQLGKMFDGVGAQQRRGTAIFTQSAMSQAPEHDEAPAAWVNRMRFFTACHEIGHGFNLAHSAQASLGMPWLPQVNEREARSFMNEPRDVSGGRTEFFNSFRFRFSDQELRFLRHAPRYDVQMGGVAWFDRLGFGAAAASPQPRLELSVRVNRKRAVMQFLEPVMVELKLKNRTGEPLHVPVGLLEDGHDLTLVVQRDGQPARQWQPYATVCRAEGVQTLEPGQSLYAPVFVGAARSGWLLAEPGRYRVQACLQLEGEEPVVSAPLWLRVAAPRSPDEDLLAQDVFTDDIGRVLAFDGTRELSSANNVLREVLDKLPDRAVGTHAGLALGMPLRRPGKLLRGSGDQLCIQTAPPHLDEARELLTQALLGDCAATANTLGHVAYRDYTDELASWLVIGNDVEQACQAVHTCCDTLLSRVSNPLVRADLEQWEQLFLLLKGPGRAKPRAGRPPGRKRDRKK